MNNGSLLHSISLNLAQYEITVKKVGKETVPLNPLPLDAKIPGDSVFVEMIKEKTVFLHDDELPAVTVL